MIRHHQHHHVQVFVSAAKLRTIADVLERKAERFQLAQAGQIHSQKDTGDADFFLEVLKHCSIEGGDVSVHFRIPEEKELGIVPRPHDPQASTGATPQQ